MIRECLDRDPEARPTAGNVAYHMTNMLSSSLQDLRQPISTPVLDNNPVTTSNHTSIGRSHSYISSINPVLIQENSQSSPPPCYSPTDPNTVPFLSRMGLRQDRNHIRNSTPHIVQTEVGSETETVQNVSPYRSSRSLRSSVTMFPFSSEVERGTGVDDQDHLSPSHRLHHSPDSEHVHSSSELTRHSSIDSGSSSLGGNLGNNLAMSSHTSVSGINPVFIQENSQSLSVTTPPEAEKGGSVDNQHHPSPSHQLPHNMPVHSSSELWRTYILPSDTFVDSGSSSLDGSHRNVVELEPEHLLNSGMQNSFPISDLVAS